MKPPSQTETDLPPPPFGGAQGAAHRFAQDLNRARYRTSDPEQLLGEGGIGRVIIAEETLLRRPVAMKTLRDDRGGELYEARLIREARITGLLEHPSIVPVHDIGRNDDGKIYYTMKKVVGLTLREVIEHLRPATGDTTDEAKALRESVQERFGSIPARLGLFQKVCDAIAFAHAHPLRVIHRDLKPENIMVGEFGEVLVMDWGLAKVLATDEEALSEALPLESGDQTSPVGFTLSHIALSTAGQFVGTPMYAAPEQLEGRLEDIDEKSDVYALGGVLYHLLTLEAPISGESQDTAEDKSPVIVTQTAAALGSAPNWDSLVRFIRGGHVASLLRESTGSKSIPEALRPLLQRALAPDRSQRIASVSLLHQAISQFLAGYANTFEEAGAWKHFIYFVKRHKGVALATAAAFSIIAALTAGFTHRLTRELTETNRQFERSQVEEGRAWLERGRAALNNGDHLSALMLAGRAVGYQGFGRRPDEDDEFSEQFPLLLGKPMKTAALENSRLVENQLVHQFIQEVQPTCLPLWDSGPMKFRVTCAVFSKDGSRFANATGDMITLWDAYTGKKLRCLKGPKDLVVKDIAFSPDGKRLAGASFDHSVRLWDTASGVEVMNLQGHTDTVSGVEFAPDGAHLATASFDKTIKIWDAVTGKERATLHGHTDKVSKVIFSPDGARLASASADKTVKLWNSDGGKELASLQHANNVLSLAFDLNGGVLASGSSDHAIRLWNTATAEELGVIQGHRGPVISVAFSQHGSHLASGSADNSIKLWNSYTGKEIANLSGHKEWVMSVAFSPDDSRLVSGSYDKTVKLWDVRMGEETGGFQAYFDSGVLSIAFTPNDMSLATSSGDRMIKLWDTITGLEIGRFEGHAERVRSIAISRNSSLLASGSADNTIKLWDIASRKEIASLKGHTSQVLSVAFSPDGTRLISGSADNTAKLWDVATRKQTASFKGHTDVVWSVVFSPDGTRVASGSEDGTAKLWDAISGKEIATLGSPIGSQQVKSVAFSPDGTRLATGSKDQTITLWDVVTGKESTRLRGHAAEVSSVAFCPDGTSLASGSLDGAVKLWDIVTGKECASFQGHSWEVTCITFSSDGLLLASGLRDGGVRLWHADRKRNNAFKPDTQRTLDLALPLRLRLLTMPDRKVAFPETSQSSPMIQARQDAQTHLADPKLTPERRAELSMELCTKSSQFRAATAQWQRLMQGEWPGFEGATVPKGQAPATISANSPIRRLYLLALIDATKHPQIHGHPTICQTAAQIAPVLTKEMMALPTISLAMMSLMQALTEDETAEMKAPRDSLLQKLSEVASHEWLEAFQAATTKP